MPIYSTKPVEIENAHTLRPLGTDRAIFGELEEKWKTLRNFRLFLLTPMALIGTLAPFVYVALWPIFRDFRLQHDTEWWFWQVLAVLGGLGIFCVVWRYYKHVLTHETQHNEALDALDAQDYHNPLLVLFSTGRRASKYNNLCFLTEAQIQEWTEKAQHAGPHTAEMWQRWINCGQPIRICDLYTLEKMILKERWGDT